MQIVPIRDVLRVFTLCASHVVRVEPRVGEHALVDDFRHRGRAVKVQLPRTAASFSTYVSKTRRSSSENSVQDAITETVCDFLEPLLQFVQHYRLSSDGQSCIRCQQVDPDDRQPRKLRIG